MQGLVVTPENAILSDSDTIGKHHVPSRDHPYRVLHIEDEDMPAEVVNVRLRHDDPGLFELQRAATLAEAIRLINPDHLPDCVLLDLNLPDSQGWETFSQIRQRVDGVPIVILTGESDEAFATQLIEAGAQDFLFKQDLKFRGMLSRTLCHSMFRAKTLRMLEESNQRLKNQRIQLEQTITHLHQTQLALAEAEKVKTIGRLAAGIAHEVKNPLAIISMGLDYLERAKPENLHRARERILPELELAVSRANTIISELLSYAAPRPIHVEPSSLNTVVSEVIGFLRPMFQEASLTLECHLCPTLPDLPLDAQKITQVLINLVANAIHATPPGGTITITTHDTEIQLEEDTPEAPSLPAILLEVRDTGPGIPDELVDQIYEPFFTTKQNRGGTGLGLCVSRMIMELHGGRLIVANHPEGGASARMMFLV
ncbi:MAG TPA: ATP-binding protein [Kiritimatiellia bacterium]|nr:ATP-binding protein [Kiritimatiellia bacterium]